MKKYKTHNANKVNQSSSILRSEISIKLERAQRAITQYQDEHTQWEQQQTMDRQQQNHKRTAAAATGVGWAGGFNIYFGLIAEKTWVPDKAGLKPVSSPTAIS